MAFRLLLKQTSPTLRLSISVLAQGTRGLWRRNLEDFGVAGDDLGTMVRIPPLERLSDSLSWGVAEDWISPSQPP